MKPKIQRKAHLSIIVEGRARQKDFRNVRCTVAATHAIDLIEGIIHACEKCPELASILDSVEEIRGKIRVAERPSENIVGYT